MFRRRNSFYIYYPLNFHHLPALLLPAIFHLSAWCESFCRVRYYNSYFSSLPFWLSNSVYVWERQTCIIFVDDLLHYSGFSESAVWYFLVTFFPYVSHLSCNQLSLHLCLHSLCLQNKIRRKLRGKMVFFLFIIAIKKNFGRWCFENIYYGEYKQANIFLESTWKSAWWIVKSLMIKSLTNYEAIEL